MSRFPLIGSGLLVCFLFGCESAHRGGRLYSDVTGIVAEPSPGTFVLHPLSFHLEPYERVETDQIVKVEISQLTPQANYDYSVLFGPPFGVPGATVEGWLHASSPVFVGGDGWLFFWGHNPFGSIRWVSALAYGSTIVLQTVDSTRQRVYYLGGSPTGIEVRCPPDAKKPFAKWTLSDSYVDVILDPSTGGYKLEPSPDTTGWISAPNLVSTSTDPTVTSFLPVAKAAATKAGWDSSRP